MEYVTRNQIRMFRLQHHHLDRYYHKADVYKVVGACGMQNTPPEIWQSSLFLRIPTFTLSEMTKLLYEDKTLVQAWSYRGAPIIFPTIESDVFLTSLIAKENEEWIYTHGIQLALDYLDMTFSELFTLCQHVMSNLNASMICGKRLLDQTIADWIRPLLPVKKQTLWDAPSMYGANQTVGGGVVSFLLRPCAMQGRIVFGVRCMQEPHFHSYENWIGHTLSVGLAPEKQLVRKFLHCHGPSNVHCFKQWLGCSSRQANRLWRTIEDEIIPVTLYNRTQRFILKEDAKQLFTKQELQTPLRILCAHDPYLDVRDRDVILPDVSLHKAIWKSVSNPGVVLYKGKIIGFWKQKKQKHAICYEVHLWKEMQAIHSKLEKQFQALAMLQQQTLQHITYHN